jgi:hypothetical protein
MTNRIKIAFILFLMCLACLFFINRHKNKEEVRIIKCDSIEKERDSLREEIKNFEMEIELLSEDYDRIYEENQVFTSMLGQIENEPGGSKMLKELFDSHN